MGLKEFYYSMEDKWYGLLDKIDKKIPVYKVIDKIDKVIPSFILFLIIIAIIIIALAILLLGSIAPEMTTVKFKVMDEEGITLSGIEALISWDGNELSELSDDEGLIQAEVWLGAELTVLIEEARFEEYEKTFIVMEREQAFNIVLTRKEIPAQEITVEFTSKGALITGKEIKLKVSCSPYIPLEKTTYFDDDKDGRITVIKPGECDVMEGTATIDGYKSKKKILNDAYEEFDLEEEGQPINPSEEEGKIQVEVEDMDGGILDDILVTLYDDYDVYLDSDYTINGTVIFDYLEPGYYSIVVEDDLDGRYGTEREGNLRVYSDETTYVTVQMQKESYTIIARVMDLSSEERIPDATVELKDVEGSLIGSRDTGEDGEDVNFSVSDEVPAFIYARAEGYLPNEIDLNSDTREVDIYLEVMTPENSGRIHINVVDEDDKAVENARVLIMDAETDFRANYPAKFSDADGNVNYTGVKEGTYYILAQKGRAEGKSGEKTIEIDEVNEFLVQVEFGDTTLNIEIVDEDGKAIIGPGSEAEVRNASDGELLGTVVLVPEGKGEITLRADKTVYVVAYAEGFEQTQTTPIELIKDEIIDVQIMLKRPLVIENPVIEMTIFDEEKKEVGTNVPLMKGKEYTAKLKLRIPQNPGVQRAGIHFRVGTSPAMENDDLYLKDIIVSNAMIIKGTTWNKDSYEEDKSYIVDAAEKGKWVNIEWQNAEPGTYEAKIKFFVKLDAEDEALAGIYYNGWFATKSGNQYRDPEDFESAQIMYANVHSPEYYIELIPEIEKVIKMTEEKILNLNETYEVYEEEPYLLQDNGKFRYDFTITNMSDEVYDDLLLSIRNYDNGKLQEDIEFDNYTISADVTKNGNANNANEILNIATGRFRSYKTIEGEIDFTTKEEGKTLIQIKLLDRKTHTYIFTSELEFEVVADGKIILKEEKILNLNEEISVYEIEPYNLSVHGDYQYEFTLKNMSNKSYNNPALTLMNSDNGSVMKEDIGFGKYKFVDGINVNGDVHNENEIENIGIGDFSRNDMVNGETEFKTEKEETATAIFMKLTDKDSKEVVFTHKTSFRIISDNTFLIDFSPETIPAYKETDLEVVIRDEKKKEPVEGTRVTVKIQEIGKRATGIRTKETPENGRVNFFIESLSPEHVIWIEAKKTGFITKKIYITLDGLELDIPEECTEVDEACIRDENVQLEEVIGVEPKRINSDLKVGDKEEEIFGLIFNNKIGIDFYISDLTIVPEFTWNGLVKNVQMQNWLNQWVQGKGRKTVIPAYGPNNDSSLKTVINPSMVRNQEAVEGTLIINVRNDEHDREYAYSIPVEIGVSPGGFVEVQNCLIVSGPEVPEWIASAEPGQPSTIHFTLTNNCKVGDRYVELENVQAKLDWKSNQIGSFDLALNGGSVSLKGSSWVIALDRMDPEEVLDGYLTFTPLGLTKAQLNAEAMIHFNGEVLARGGEGSAVMMKVNTENASNTFIHADLKIINLRKCINTVPDEIISFDENSFEEELTIENKCDIPLKIRLCKDEGVWGCGMDSDVLQFEGFQFKQAERNFPEFELDSNGERTLTIKRKEFLPLGAYSIKIEARQVEDNEFYYREIARPRVEILGSLYMEKLFLAIDKEGGKYLAEQDILHNKEVGKDGFGAYVDPIW
ncbi:MAG: carboxypeptidase-like regulatory domain-containing protein, partial [archaeon]